MFGDRFTSGGNKPKRPFERLQFHRPCVDDHQVCRWQPIEVPTGRPTKDTAFLKDGAKLRFILEQPGY